MTAARLLMTADAVGGVWQYATDLAEALAPHGVETVLALLGPSPGAAQHARAEAIPGLTLIDTGLPLDWTGDGAAPVVHAGEAIAELAAETAADIVQLNMPTLGARAHFAAPVVAVTHGCVGTWWQAARQRPLDPGFAWHRAMMRDGLARADFVVAPSAAYGGIVQRYYELPHAPLIVHNGRIASDAAPAAHHDHALTVGRLWDTVKQAELLDAAAARLAIPFHAAGAVVGPHGERVALDHLNLLGQLDAARIAERLAAQPVFVSAASFEPFGLAVLEAAQAGCALVLSDIPTFRELWDGAALFVPEQTPEAYVRAIEHVIGNEHQRRTLGEAARARAARYTPAATATAMARLYRALIATRPAKREAA
ncbi:MAG TPA: glycosyltransferase family 4 protein [Sphingomonas sp.]|nr:glycosyltransferase family 4 protein [Sphingomonas sp.]